MPKYYPSQAIRRLQDLASNAPRGTMGDTLRLSLSHDWTRVPGQEQQDIVAAIKEGVGKYNIGQLFWLFWAAARLDINLFSLPFECGSALLANLKEKISTEGASLPARQFPKVIWAFALYLRKYADGQPALSTQLLQHLQIILDIFEPKIKELEKNKENVFLLLLQTKQLLQPYQKQIAWPARLSVILATSDEKDSSLEKEVLNALRWHCSELSFKKGYEIPEIYHVVDIVISDKKVAIEVDGPGHFYEDSENIDTKTWIRNQLLKDNGWRVITVPYFEWDRIKDNDNGVRDYLRGKLSSYLPGQSIEQRSTDSQHKITPPMAIKDIKKPKEPCQKSQKKRKKHKKKKQASVVDDRQEQPLVINETISRDAQKKNLWIKEFLRHPWCLQTLIFCLSVVLFFYVSRNKPDGLEEEKENSQPKCGR